MARYKNVRNTEKKQPTQQQATEAFVESIRQAADEMFEQRGGKDLEASLLAMRETLQLYREEIQRARECDDRDKFKWLVKPSEGIRAEREVTRLNQLITGLRERCLKEAEELMTVALQHYSEPAEPADQPAPTDQPTPSETQPAKPNTTAPPEAA